MKIEELAIIFIIIILPISLLLSEYTQFQIQTIQLQTEYDAKLTSATYDAIRAFQLNTANNTTSDIANSKIRDIEASVSAFRNSIMLGFKLNGYTDEDLNNYIPVLVYTLYDGFYIYSPYKNVVDESGEMIEDGNEQESLYGLKPYINYSCRYQTSNIDVVITYALDNYISVQGMVGDEYVNKSGYLIDGIEIDDEKVTYNGVEIGTEQLKENFGGKTYPYFKYNGIKYYLIEDKEQIVYNLNGTLTVQYSNDTNPKMYTRWKNLIENNTYAQDYYKDAYEFTDWFKSTGLVNLKYSDAIEQEIFEDGTTKFTKVWESNNTTIFDFKSEDDATSSNNIENEMSEFNQHRLAVIRYKIETNLAIAIANYNTYSGSTANEFQMPELKEGEWEQITHNISMISFLQGLPIGGKIYNGYSLVTNSESKEVVLEEYIYILGADGNYHKIGDKYFEGSGTVDAGNYGAIISAGRLNLDFERNKLVGSDNINTYYYYPLQDYDASYDSIVMQNKVNTYDDIYEYVNNQSNEDLKKAFYTALGRERYSMYKISNTFEYSVLVVGKGISSDDKTKINNITKELNEERSIKATCIFATSTDATYLANYMIEQKDNYDLIIVDSFVWPIITSGTSLNKTTLSEIANATNLITISNDQTGLPMMESSTTGNATVTPAITELGSNKIGNISITGILDTQALFKFKEDVEVFYTGTYTGEITGEYDLIGCWQNGNYKWIHSQIALGYRGGTTVFSKEMELLKSLVEYALNIN